MTDIEIMTQALALESSHKQKDQIEGFWMRKRLIARIGGQAAKDMKNLILGRERQNRNAIRSMGDR
jgi:hypothetical protein